MLKLDVSVAVADDAMTCCSSCGVESRADTLNALPAASGLSAGDTIPAGRCWRCGGLSYLLAAPSLPPSVQESATHQRGSEALTVEFGIGGSGPREFDAITQLGQIAAELGFSVGAARNMAGDDVTEDDYCSCGQPLADADGGDGFCQSCTDQIASILELL